MKKVTICISFSCKDGLARNVYKIMATLVGWSSVGMQSSSSAKEMLKTVLSLLEGTALLTDDFHIDSVTLGERKWVKHPDAGATKS